MIKTIYSQSTSSARAVTGIVYVLLGFSLALGYLQSVPQTTTTILGCFTITASNKKSGIGLFIVDAFNYTSIIKLFIIVSIET